MNPNSKKFSFNWIDFISLGRNAVLVGIAASLAYMSENIAELDFGTSGVLMVPIIVVLIEGGGKWAKDNMKSSD
tara:strand:+ start:1566 stop:1787 length:222 start_codon:yes stop_codon:yes gene_type:complete